MGRSPHDRWIGPLARGMAFVLLVALAGCSSSDDPSADDPATEEPTTDASTAVDQASLDQPGAFGVGRSTVTVVDEAREGRSLTTDVWYPIEPDAGAEPSIYQLVPRAPGFDHQIAKADEPLADDGPFPLLVFSHGSPSVRWQSLFVMELLASHGFVVVAPDHAGDSAVDALAGDLAAPAENEVNRPTDVSFMIDAVLAGEVAEPTGLADAVDPERIGIIGHSVGGATVLTAAGGLRDLPPDDRIDAVLAWTPFALGVPDESLAAIDVPTMVIGADRDDIAPTEPNVERVWDTVPGRPLYRADLRRGGHDQFGIVCDLLAAADANPDFPTDLRPLIDIPAQDACTPEFLPIDEAHTLIARYSLAFALAHVAGNDQAVAWLQSAEAASASDLSVNVKE